VLFVPSSILSRTAEGTKSTNLKSDNQAAGNKKHESRELGVWQAREHKARMAAVGVTEVREQKARMLKT
jgi:hypothetical protein